MTDRKLMVLLVDDDVNLLKTMFLILSHKGYSVATAENGHQAVDMMAEKSFDVVFMDIRMPGMDGVECYERVQQIRPGVPVFMMTAYTSDDRIQKVLQKGAREVLSKPLNMDRVLAILEEL